MLGNGWTIEVIKHILRFLPNKKNMKKQELQLCSFEQVIDAGLAISVYDLDINPYK
jgi:hypothetical protein